ncbi:hypothetical protein AB0H71_27205 [Nocardia sp. NPDC050697]|uniref:hypothetical protein n=1 Tax=Nocardia sp. NPDC050697 TaxID=3155158 RepID=UPI0033F91999
MDNPASALYEILNRVVRSRESTIAKSWSAALAAPIGSHEFIQRHCEVVRLFTAVHQRLLGLPEGDRARNRSLQYLPAWYDVVVPREHWQNPEVPPSDLIETPVLGLLESVGDIFDLQDREVGAAVDRAALERLRESLHAWRDLLNETTLPETLATQIRHQVAHIEWLLDNVELFGGEPVVTAAGQLLGTGVSTMSRRPSLAKRAAAAMAGIILFLTQVEDGIDLANGVLEGLVEVRESIVGLLDGTPQLTAPAEE